MTVPIALFFRLRAGDGRIASCRSLRTARGIELQFGFDDTNPTMTEVVTSHNGALQLASQWRSTLVSRGAFSEIESGVRELRARSDSAPRAPSE